MLFSNVNIAYANETTSILKPPKKAYMSNIMQILEDYIEMMEPEWAYQRQIHQLIDDAKSCLGVPYVWGGTSMRGFDCSGFVQYVYRQQGIELPRVASSQRYAGQRVSLDELLPGDLIFWSSHHVGLYIGDGQYIHAPQSGDVVRIADLSGRYPTSATRIIIK